VFESFSHFLSYGATDQQTARDLSGSYDGLLVPGTVAAFQADGTRGFVLTLSATANAPRYAIDPRFPLFQQALPAAKRSHIALAELFGIPDLVQRVEALRPDEYTNELIERITRNWLQFNSGFTELTMKKFDKYAERLDEIIVPHNRKGPSWILPPYFIAQAEDARWQQLSERLWRAAQEQSPTNDRLVRVVATDSTATLDSLLNACEEDRLAVWISQLDERQVDRAGRDDLTEYGRAIRDASERGQRIFALYGGFFSVLLGIFGLRGSSHGIGYGEARAWEELPQSGPPPARYYLPNAHRYISMDLALLFWREDRELVICDCPECEGQSPARLDYHGLMRHSVRCRSEEIRRWVAMSPETAIGELTHQADVFEDAIDVMDIPRRLRRPADDCYLLLRGWARVIRAIAA
jgi:hypothetical protein